MLGCRLVLAAGTRTHRHEKEGAAVSISLEEEARFYDERWRNFGFANRLKLERCVAILDAIRRTRLVQPKIIDFGCGAGWLTSILGLFGPTTGVELSPEAVEKASSSYPHVRFVQGDVRAWKSEELFDVAVSQEVIEHLEDQAQHVDLAADLLRPGGFFIVTTPNAKTFLALPKKQRDKWSNQPIEKLLTVAELVSYLARRLEILEVRTIVALHGLKGWRSLMNSTRLDGIKLRMGLGLHTIAVARKPNLPEPGLPLRR